MPPKRKPAPSAYNFPEPPTSTTRNAMLAPPAMTTNQESICPQAAAAGPSYVRGHAPPSLRSNSRQPSFKTVFSSRSRHSHRSRRSHTTSENGTAYGDGASLFGFITFSPAPIIALPITYMYTHSVQTSIKDAPVDTGDEARKKALIFKRLRKDVPPFSPRHRKYMIVGLWAVLFLGGWNDASTGPLLPMIREYYGLNYISAGYIWITNFVGFLIAGLSNVWVTDHLGFGIAAPMATAAQAIAYALILIKGPYPLYLIAFIFNGFGQGFLDALVNGFTTRLPDAQTKIFINGAMYAVGATISPLVTTAFVSNLPTKVFFYYAAPLCLALVNITILILAFQFRTTDQIVCTLEDAEERGIETREKGVQVPLSLEIIREETSQESFERRPSEATNSTETTAVERFPTVSGAETDSPTPREKGKGRADTQTPSTPDHPPAALPTRSSTPRVIVPLDPGEQVDNSTAGKMKRIYRNPISHMLGLYVLLYAGAQSILAGWAATYLGTVRHGGSDVGYVNTGIFAGMFLGRVFLLPVVDKIGKSSTVFLCTLSAMTLTTIIWAVPNLYSSATAFALLGFTFAPLAPCLTLVTTEILPVDLHPGTLAWTGSLGCFGAAALPFLISAISDSQGPWIIAPFLMGILTFSLIIYTFLPKPKKVAQEGDEAPDV